MTLNDRPYDIIVIGAGIVGSSVSTALGRSGRRVLVLERDLNEPDRIVGELLQPGGVRALQLLGLADTLEGIDAIPAEGYHIFLSPEESVKIAYPAVAELPSSYGRSEPLGKNYHYAGRSFHHGRFIMNLRRKMNEQENVTVKQATVTNLLHDPKDQRVVGVESSAGTFKAPVTIVADGIFSKFRKEYGGAYKPKVRSHFVGLELPPDAVISRYHGHVILNQQAAKEAVPGKAVGPALVYQIGSDATRLLVDVPGPTLPSVGNGDLARYLRDIVAPCLPKVIGEALAQELDKGSRLRTMSNSFLPPSMQGMLKHQYGMVVVGDAMNMRHPLTGGGMTVAFWDSVYLTHILGGGQWSPLDGYDDSMVVPPAARDLTQWSVIQPLLREWHWKRKKLASVINILAMSLYSLFGVPDDNLTILRAGCFRYFECGGDCVRGPISLLAGLAPDPMLLVYHFFSVAVYSVQLMFRGDLFISATSSKKVQRPPLYMWPALCIRALIVLLYACFVIFPVIYTEIRTNIATQKTVWLNPSLLILTTGMIGLASSVYAIMH
ncbi:Squalene epoxidase [Malassezia pachydermatis]|uniref:Squalene monooxygenase n=1 Tax=Malassezia pachydermatis TaxID=77020 RepID=A0A0N0RSD0_9BASI|nr:squalene monooxygenase [Malassezia pachydermatis]KOS14729.1 squalene monooxygenase [Malassezia pachydermatis]